MLLGFICGVLELNIFFVIPIDDMLQNKHRLAGLSMPTNKAGTNNERQKMRHARMIHNCETWPGLFQRLIQHNRSLIGSLPEIIFEIIFLIYLKSYDFNYLSLLIVLSIK